MTNFLSLTESQFQKNATSPLALAKMLKSLMVEALAEGIQWRDLHKAMTAYLGHAPSLGTLNQFANEKTTPTRVNLALIQEFLKAYKQQQTKTGTRTVGEVLAAMQASVPLDAVIFSNLPGSSLVFCTDLELRFTLIEGPLADAKLGSVLQEFALKVFRLDGRSSLARAMKAATEGTEETVQADMLGQKYLVAVGPIRFEGKITGVLCSAIQLPE